MDQYVDTAIKVLESSSEPLLFDELLQKVEIPSDLQETFCLQLKKSTDVFFHDYSVEDKTITLFWRADLRRKKADEAFTTWLKDSALVYLSLLPLTLHLAI